MEGQKIMPPGWVGYVTWGHDVNWYKCVVLDDTTLSLQYPRGAWDIKSISDLNDVDYSSMPPVSDESKQIHAFYKDFNCLRVDHNLNQTTAGMIDLGWRKVGEKVTADQVADEIMSHKAFVVRGLIAHLSRDYDIFKKLK